MTEYRPVTDAHRSRYRAIAQQAFDAESGPLRSEGDEPESAGGDDPWPPDLSDPRGVFVDDELVSICKLYSLDATIRGEWTAVGGLGSVATPPEHRRQGYSRVALRGALRDYRERGTDFVALWPSTVRFYRGLGWGTANWKRRTEVPPAQLAGVESPDAATEAASRFVELGVDDWERLRPVETARAERFGLSLRRSERWWRKRTLAPWPGSPAPYVYGYEVDGELRGYVLTHVLKEADGTVLKVDDIAGVDHTAERALLGLLANHDSQVETVRCYGPLAGELHELVPDPGELDARTTEGPMVRLTDVERGLESLRWPAGIERQFVLAVADPLLDRNDGTFRVAVSGGSLVVEPASVDDDPDATVGIGTLSRLTVGAIGVERARRVGDLSIRDDGVRSTLDGLFAPEPVCLREFF